MTAPVLVYGYPVGGNSLSVTKGIVSRIGFGQYDGGTMGLYLQVDAAINPGNSGGPALVDGKMVGLAFRGWSGPRVSASSCPMRKSTRSSKMSRTAHTRVSPSSSGEYQSLENERSGAAGARTRCWWDDDSPA